MFYNYFRGGLLVADLLKESDVNRILKTFGDYRYNAQHELYFSTDKFGTKHEIRKERGHNDH